MVISTTQLFVLLLPVVMYAHQPVMDMAPRWKGGYGFQTRYEYSSAENLDSAGSNVSNTQNLFKTENTIHLEGVYTFTRAHRLTFKLPWRGIEQDLLGGNTKSGSGLGNLILGFQNKYYFNKPHLTGNISATPSISTPAFLNSNGLKFGRETFDFSLSLSASVEAFMVYTLLDAFYWYYTEDSDNTRLGNYLGVDFDIGIHPYHDMHKNMGVFVISGFNFRTHSRGILASGSKDNDSGGESLEIAPTLVLYKDNIMLRAQYHVPFYQNLNGLQLKTPNKISVGAGIVFQSF